MNLLSVAEKKIIYWFLSVTRPLKPPNSRSSILVSMSYSASSMMKRVRPSMFFNHKAGVHSFVI